MKKFIAVLNIILLMLMGSSAFAADTPISGLANGGVVQTGDAIPVDRGGANFRVNFGAAAALGLGPDFTSVGGFLFLNLGNETGALQLPIGTTGQRPTPSSGMIRYNSTVPQLEAYINGAWTALGSGGGSGSPGGSNGNLQINSSGSFGPYAGITCASHKWLNALDANGNLSTDCVQPNFTDLAGTASNAQIPAPTTSALGGIEALASATANQVVQYIDTLGIQHLIQLGFSNLSGTIATGQFPASGATAGSYGSSSSIPAVTVDATGRVTSISTNTVSVNVATQVTGSLPLSNLASISANTVLGETAAGVPIQLSMPSCSGATNALIWTTNVGIGCNTITGGGGSVSVTAVDGTHIVVSPSPGTSTFTLDIGSAVATSAKNLGFFAATTSAQLAGVISDGTGAGVLFFTGGNFGAATGTSAAVSGNLTSSGGEIGIGTTSPVVSLDVSQKTDAIALPGGTTGQRPASPISGMLRLANSPVQALESYFNGAWNPVVVDGVSRQINVTAPPYYASGFIAQTKTSGSVTSGTTNISVLSSTNFSTGQIVIVSEAGSGGNKNFAGFISAIPDGTHITVSATAVSGTLLPPTATGSTTGTQTTIPSGYIVYSLGTTTLSSSVSTGATSIPVTNAASYRVGQGVMIIGGGAAGINIITQITAISGNTLTINPGIANASGVSSGAGVQHDDTAAFQAAVNLASYNQSVNIFVPDGFYQINGFPVNTGTANAQIQLPSLDYYPSSFSVWNAQSTIQIMGNAPAPMTQSYLASNVIPNMSGAIIHSDLNQSGIYNQFAGYNSNSDKNFTNIQLIVKNITFRAYPNPNYIPLNGGEVPDLRIDGVSFDTGDSGGTTQPTHTSNYAWVGPVGQNGGNNVFANIEVLGYYNGVQVSEHTRLEHIRFDNVFQPMVLANTVTVYGVTGVDIQFNGCPHGILDSGGNNIPIQIELLNIEHQNGAWTTNVEDIKDTGNLLYGLITTDDYNGGFSISYPPTVNGATNLVVADAVHSPAFPFEDSTFAGLSSSHLSGSRNGRVVYCSDCTPTPTCAGSGTGAYAMKLNSTWTCNGSGVSSALTGSGTSAQTTCWSGTTALGNCADQNPAYLDVAQSYTKGQAVTPDTSASCGTQTAGGTMTPNFANANDCVATFGAGNLIIAAPTNVKAGQSYAIWLTQDGTGSRTATWNAAFKWPGATAPTLSTGAGDQDGISCKAVTTSQLNCVLAGTNFH